MSLKRSDVSEDRKEGGLVSFTIFRSGLLDRNDEDLYRYRLEGCGVGELEKVTQVLIRLHFSSVDEKVRIP